MSELADSLKSLQSAANASDAANVEDWLSEWTQKGPSSLTELVARSLRSVEELVGTGGSETARLVSSFLAHVETQQNLPETGRHGFDASTATILNPTRSDLNDGRLLVTGFGGTEQAWTSLDRSFRRYKAVSSSGVIESSALDRCRRIALRQASTIGRTWRTGAVALVDAIESFWIGHARWMSRSTLSMQRTNNIRR